MVKFLILKEIHSSKFMNLNPASYFTNLLLSLCYVALIENVLCFYLFSGEEAFCLLCRYFYLFILFIDGSTELGDSNLVTTLTVTECAAPFVEQL